MKKNNKSLTNNQNNHFDQIKSTVREMCGNHLFVKRKSIMNVISKKNKLYSNYSANIEFSTEECANPSVTYTDCWNRCRTIPVVICNQSKAKTVNEENRTSNCQTGQKHSTNTHTHTQTNNVSFFRLFLAYIDMHTRTLARIHAHQHHHYTHMANVCMYDAVYSQCL